MRRTYSDIEIQRVLSKAYDKKIKNYNSGYAQTLWLLLANVDYNTSDIFVDSDIGYCEVNLNIKLPEYLNIIDNNNIEKGLTEFIKTSDAFSRLGAYLFTGNDFSFINKLSVLESKKIVTYGDGKFDNYNDYKEKMNKYFKYIEEKKEGVKSKQKVCEPIKYHKYLNIYAKIYSPKIEALKQETLHMLYLKFVENNILIKKEWNVKDFYNGVKWNEKRLMKDDYIREITNILISEGYLNEDLTPNVRKFRVKTIISRVRDYTKRICPICGEEFMPRQSDALICSKQTCRNTKSRYKDYIWDEISKRGYCFPLGEKEKDTLINRLKKINSNAVKRNSMKEIENWKVFTTLLFIELKEDYNNIKNEIKGILKKNRLKEELNSDKLKSIVVEFFKIHKKQGLSKEKKKELLEYIETYFGNEELMPETIMKDINKVNIVLSCKLNKKTL